LVEGEENEGAAALQAVKELAPHSPQSAPIQDFLGMLLLAAGDRNAARAAIVSAKQADPKFVQADLLLVQLDVADGHLDNAERRLSELLARGPENGMAQLWLGNVQEMRGEHSAALEPIPQGRSERSE
jgi:predicted Zn-dependent protease